MGVGPRSDESLASSRALPSPRHALHAFLIRQVGDPAGFAGRIVKLMAGPGADDDEEEEPEAAPEAAADAAEGGDGDVIEPEVIDP